MEKERVLVAVRQVKNNHTLPKEVGEALRSLSLKERRAYATRLCEAGWTLQSVANELKLTRESIRLYTLANSNNQSDVQLAIKDLPIPEIPTKEVYKSLIKRLGVEPSDVVRLKELHSKARLVRGKGKNYRDEAEQFAQLVKELTDKGVSVYRIAKEVGVTPAGIYSRLVRYGYKTTNGKSKAYRTITNRKEG